MTKMKKYKHMTCDECGGILGMYNRQNDDVTCENCHKLFSYYGLKYDTIQINSMTGWRFPMVLRDKESEE